MNELLRVLVSLYVRISLRNGNLPKKDKCSSSISFTVSQMTMDLFGFRGDLIIIDVLAISIFRDNASFAPVASDSVSM